MCTLHQSSGDYNATTWMGYQISLRELRSVASDNGSIYLYVKCINFHIIY